MKDGAGNETDTRGRWGDYTMTTIDPSDGMTFWHVNQYLPSSSTGFNWMERIGKFNFGGGGTPTPTPGTPTPTPTPVTPTPTPTPIVTPTPTPRATPLPRPRPTPHPRPTPPG